MRGHLWSEEQDAKLLQLLGEGYSARAAAAKFGTTSNSIIGRAHRLAKKSPVAAKVISIWSRRPGSCHEPADRRRRAGPKSAATTKPKAVAPAPRPFVRLPKGRQLDALGEAGRQEVSRAMRSTAFMPTPDRQPVRLEDLGDGCKWPLGEPGHANFGFCGARREPGKSPYCAHHHAIAYTTAPVRSPAPVDVRRVPSRGDRQFMGSLG
jgi:GcrA cell cycle regulator